MKLLIGVLALTVLTVACNRATPPNPEQLERERAVEVARLDAIFEPRVGMPVGAEGNTLLIAEHDADTMSRDEFVCALQEVGFKDNLFKQVQIAVLDVATRTKDVKATIPLPLRMSADECRRVKAASRRKREPQNIPWNPTSAMTRLFGDYDSTAAGYKWTASVPTAKDDLVGFDGKSMVAKVLVSKQYDENGAEKAILVAWSKSLGDYDCHACAVLLSAFVFSPEDGDWKIEHQSKYLGAAGSWGKPPDSVRVVRASSGKTALSVSDSYVAQGEVSVCEWVAVAENGIFSIQKPKCYVQTPGQ
jgi:hypothetical protein